MELSTAFINLFPLPFNNFSKFFVLQKNKRLFSGITIKSVSVDRISG